jgi:hypothetical protein
MRRCLQDGALDSHTTLLLFYSCYSLCPKAFSEALFSPQTFDKNLDVDLAHFKDTVTQNTLTLSTTATKTQTS